MVVVVPLLGGRRVRLGQVTAVRMMVFGNKEFNFVQFIRGKNRAFFFSDRPSSSSCLRTTVKKEL